MAYLKRLLGIVHEVYSTKTKRSWIPFGSLHGSPASGGILGRFFLGVKLMITPAVRSQSRNRYLTDEFYEIIPGTECIYCGDCWEVYDHVPPIAAYVTNSHWNFKYPACKDCNSILRATPVKDIRVRRYFVLKKLFRRYSKLIKMPYWERYEVKEIKGMIRTFVKSSILKKHNILKRIDYLSENYLAPEPVNFTGRKAE